MKLSEVAVFLVEAKQNTYAGSNNVSTLPEPLLTQSKQLEWQCGDWFYRDIYFGSAYFAGQEVVYLKGRPVWSMSYSGGTIIGTSDAETKATYRILRSALRAIPADLPVRGPARFHDGEYIYQMQVSGDLGAFTGQESVRKSGQQTYALAFSGGLLR